MSDYEHWKAEGDRLRKESLWEEALLAYQRSLELNPCDTVTHTDFIATQHALNECLTHLRSYIDLVLREANTTTARSEREIKTIADRLHTSLTQTQLNAARAVLSGMLQKNDAEFAQTISKQTTLPPAIIRHFINSLFTKL